MAGAPSVIGGQFTAWLAQGNAEDEITRPLSPPTQSPSRDLQGRAVFADRDECRLALARCGFDTGSLRMDTVSALWRVPSADFLFQAQLTPESAPPQSCVRSRPTGSNPSAQ
jgi:hypothetical protein